MQYFNLNDCDRPSFDVYFMRSAFLASSRSTCIRRKVGAVLVIDNEIVATGYNGAAKKAKHCLDIGCLRQELNVPSGERHELCRAIHAEQNCIVQAARHGKAVNGSTLYCTHSPCVICAKMLVNAGVQRIVCAHYYPDSSAFEVLFDAGVLIQSINPLGTCTSILRRDADVC